MDKKLTFASILVIGIVLQVTASSINTKDGVKLSSERLLANRLKRAWTLQEAIIQEQRARRNTNSFVRSIIKRDDNDDTSGTKKTQYVNNGGGTKNLFGFAWSGDIANSNNE